MGDFLVLAFFLLSAGFVCGFVTGWKCNEL